MDKSSALRNRARVGRLLWLLSPWMLVAPVILFYPFRFAFELDADEGVNLMKSLLVNQGAELYTDVWSDQPPLLTYLIAVLFQIVGVNLTVVRLMILLFSCALFGAAVQYLRAFWGTPHAIAGGLVLILLPSYLRLSVSIMVGLPAIALALLSFLAISYWHKDKKKLWLVLSGVALALSVMTKLFTGLLAPLFVAGLIAQEWRGFRKTGSWSRFLTPAVLWTCGFGIAALLIGAISIYPDGLSQLTLTHWAAQSTEFNDPTTIAGYLSDSLPAIFLAVIGSVYVIQQGRLTGLYLMGWALAGFLLLSQVSPVWYHHQLLVTVPVAILAGVAAGEFLVAVRNRFRNMQVMSTRAALYVAVAVLIPYFAVSSLSNSISELDYRLPNLRPPPADSREIEAVGMLDVMREYADATKFILTDRPMFAIWLGKPVPPEVAALTGKRLLTGELSQAEIISAIQQYQPEQVALARFELPQVEAYLQQHYRLVYHLTDHRLYVRGDLQPNSPNSGSGGGDGRTGQR
ncbi:MAG TPA: glycosyltransferase family 39 protein [Anaerolineales bacterium]